MMHAVFVSIYSTRCTGQHKCVTDWAQHSICNMGRLASVAVSTSLQLACVHGSKLRAISVLTSHQEIKARMQYNV